VAKKKNYMEPAIANIYP